VTVGDGDDLVVDRSSHGPPTVLGSPWSAGTLVSLFGQFAGSGTGPRVPRYVMPAGRTIDGTFDADGRLYLATDGALFVTRDDEPARVTLPEGTPPPAGPIVWIP
jgi:hypothetical protein